MVSLLNLVFDDSIHTVCFVIIKQVIWAKLKILPCFFKPFPKTTLLCNLEM